MCQLCASQCQACETTFDNCVQSDGCSRGFYFFNETNSCVASCPTGFYADSITGFCGECPAGCLSCFGPSYDKCYSCGPDPNNASAVYYKKIMLNSCVADCPAGQYEETLGGYYCARCHPSCALCNLGELNCSKCKNYTGIVYYLLDDQCIVSCPNGYYGNTELNLC